MKLLFFMLLFSFRSSSRGFRRSIISKSASASTLFAESTKMDSYLSVHVKGQVNPSHVSDFYDHSLHNAQNSILEKGIARFDVLKRIDDPASNEFLLMETYRTSDGPDSHKSTSHYASWRDGVATSMAVPRSAVKYKTLFPPAHQWSTSSSASKITPKAYSALLPWVQDPFADGCAAPQNIPAGENLSSYASRGLLAVVVHVHVLAESIQSFISATMRNCKSSIMEGGVSRFDFLQDATDPTHFILVEVYNSPDAPASHKKTAHYAAWAATVSTMMAKPRTAEKYCTLFPAPLYWHQSSSSTHPGEGATEGSDGSKGLSAVTGASFGFLSPKILMGRGIAAAALRQAMKELKIAKPLIVTGKSGFERYKNSLFDVALGPEYSHFDARYTIGGEPTVEDAVSATALALRNNCDSVIAVGGGSAMDLGKAVSALMTNSGDVFEYLEVIGQGKAIQHPAAPLIAVPTTAGTGSEATKNAVLKSIKHGRKASIRHDTMLPKVAIVDPMLTVSCPPDVTAHVGLDTMCQVIEPYVSNAANPFTDALCKEAILRASRSLRAAVADGGDLEAREDLAVASVMGGLALANAKLGAVHGYAAVLGGMFEIAPHGAICAALTPHVFRKNAERLAERAALSSDDCLSRIRLNRFTDVARIITGNREATWEDGVAWLDALVKDVRVPGLGQLCGMSRSEVKAVAEATAEASSTKGNPIALSQADLEDVLHKAI